MMHRNMQIAHIHINTHRTNTHTHKQTVLSIQSCVCMYVRMYDPIFLHSTTAVAEISAFHLFCVAFLIYPQSHRHSRQLPYPFIHPLHSSHRSSSCFLFFVSRTQLTKHSRHDLDTPCPNPRFRLLLVQSVQSHTPHKRTVHTVLHHRRPQFPVYSSCASVHLVTHTRSSQCVCTVH